MITNLIAALEGAETGSLDFSDEVLLACGWQKTFDGVACDYWTIPGVVGRVYSDNRPSPSESLDDALALVPEGFGWRMDSESDRKDKRPMAMLYRAVTGTVVEVAKAATPALALCVAILKTLGGDNE